MQNHNDGIEDYIKADELRKFIEKKVLEIIKKLMDDGESSKEKLQSIARKTLELIRPGMRLDELYQNAVKLDDNISELAPVVIMIMKEYEEKYEKKALTQVQDLLKNKKYDEAEDAIKKVLQFKISS